jgi:hypothetical protein
MQNTLPPKGQSSAIFSNSQSKAAFQATGQPNPEPLLINPSGQGQTEAIHLAEGTVFSGAASHRWREFWTSGKRIEFYEKATRSRSVWHRGW